MTSKVRVEGLWSYPIKSGLGVSLEEARFTRDGIIDDRRFALCDLEGHFVSLRSCPELFQLGCRPCEAGWVLSWGDELGPTLQMPDATDSRLDFKIWGDVVDVGVMAADSNRWLSDKTGRPLRLVAFDERSSRIVDPTYAPPGTSTMLSDGFPVLLTTLESHRQLDDWAGTQQAVERMRPNLVVSGGAPFEEDSWVRLEGPEVTIELVKPCARCVATTVDPKTGRRGPEPLRTLSVHRKVGKEVMFGQNAIVVHEGIVRVGEVLTIVKRR